MEISANNLTFKTLEKTVISGAVFSCPLGQRTALVGPEGSGKKVLLLMLGGFLRPTSGSVTQDGENIFRHLKSYRKGIGLGEIDAVNPLGEELTVRENLAFAREMAGVRSDRTLMEKQLEACRLTAYADTPIKDCDPLVRALASLACASASDPSIFILDEPTRKLTSRQAALFWQVAEERLAGKTVIFSTKSFEEAEAHADKIIPLEGSSPTKGQDTLGLELNHTL